MASKIFPLCYLIPWYLKPLYSQNPLNSSKFLKFCTHLHVVSQIHQVRQVRGFHAAVDYAIGLYNLPYSVRFTVDFITFKITYKTFSRM